MPSLSQSLSVRRVTWLDLLAVFAVTVAVFSPVLRTEFSPLDDYDMLANNRAMTSPSWEGLQSFWSGPAFRIYMPLAQTVWQAVSLVSYTKAPLAGTHVLATIGFKGASVVTHALAAVAAAWAIGVVTRTRWPAVVGGLLFALHPVQVESVAWTTGLKDELCGLFTALSVGCYALHARRDRPTPWADAFWWLALGAALLAVFSKPTAMVLPLILLATDWALRRVPPVRRFVSLAAFLLPAIACGLVIATVQGDAAVPKVPFAVRPLIATDAYAFYLAKLAWPVRMSVDYGRLPTLVWDTGALWWTWLAPAAAAGGLLWLRSRVAWLAAALFVLPVLPVSGLTPFDMQQYSTVTDHYAYQPLLGVGLLVALLLARRPRPAAFAGMAVVLAALACLSWREAAVWRTPATLFRQVLAHNPRSWMARDMLGRMAMNRGDLFTAGRFADEALALNPGDGLAIDTTSFLAQLRGDYRLSADLAIKATQHVPVERPDIGKRVAQLGAMLHDRDLAEKGSRYWLHADPKNPFAREMLETILQAKRAEATTRPTGRGT